MVKTIVFDKTGTLTDDGLKVLGHRSVYQTSKGKIQYSCLTDDILCSCGQGHHSQHLQFALACCQSTKHIGDKLIGNPHDIKIFEHIGWDQTDRLNDKNGYSYTIVKPSSKNL